MKENPIPPIKITYPEVIRLRPGMYIGSVDIRGFLTLLKGILYHGINNYESQNIRVEIKGKHSIAFVFKNIRQPICRGWQEWKMDTSNNPFFTRLETLNALSISFEIKLLDGSSNIILEEQFTKGETNTESRQMSFNPIQIEVDCTLDTNIWKDNFELNPIFISSEIKNFAYLNKNCLLELSYLEQKKLCTVIHHFKNGLQDKLQLEQLNGLGDSLFETLIERNLGDLQVEIAFAFREYSIDQPILKSYVNYYYTHENGTHVDALLKGLTYGIMQYFQQQQVSHYRISEKGIKDNLVAFVHIQMDAPSFVGCVRNKLANLEILEPIANLVADTLFQKMEVDSDSTNKLIRKFEI